MITIITDYPIAFDSPDHLIPLGTKRDNHKNMKFVTSCEKILKDKKGNILDIGCAGGGCIEDFVNRGHNALGIEGSDYSLKLKRAAWNTIPDRLFTCDASRKFSILNNNEEMRFDIICSFDVMEHIHPSRLEQYFINIYNHLHVNGVFIGTFTTTKSKKFPMHHQTIMGKRGWIKFIKKLGKFKIVDLKWNPEQYLRFSKLGANCIPIAFKLK